MKKNLLSLYLLLAVSLVFAAGDPSSKRPHKFNRPENPVIRVTAVKVNSVKMWQVEVVKGTLELTNRTVLKEGTSMPLTEGQIVWKLGQVVLIGGDGVQAGGRLWKRGDRLFVDEKGRLFLVWDRARGEKSAP